MIKHDDKLVDAFCKIHTIDMNKSDVRLMEDSNYETTGVGLYKDDSYCWHSTIAEIAFDLIMEKNDA